MPSSERLLEFWENDKSNPDLAISILAEFLQGSDFDTGLSWAKVGLSDDLIVTPQIASAAGMLALGARDFDYARERFEMLHGLFPQDPNIAYNLAYAHHGLGEFEHALEVTNSVKDNWADCEAIYLLNARCHHHLAEYDAAVADVEQFLEKHPDHNQASGLLSMILLDQGEYGRAESVAQDVLQRQPDQFEAMISKVSTLIVSQDLDEAERWVAKAAEAYPNVGRIRESEGQLALMRMDYDKARAAFEESSRLMPQHIGSWHLLGWAQVLQEDYDAAADSFEKALLIDRNFAESHGGIAVVDAMRDREETARKSIRRARGLDPNNLSARFAESILLRKDGKISEADAIIDDLFATETGEVVQGLMPLLMQRIEAQRERPRNN